MVNNLCIFEAGGHKFAAKLLKYIERAGVRERVIKHKNERYTYLNRRGGRWILLLMNIKSIEYDLFFSFEYHQNAFVEIHFVTFRKKCTSKETGKMRDRVLK